MNLHLSDFLDGLAASFRKLGSDIFTTPSNTSLFPTITSQAKWKYAKGGNFLRLHDGQKVYAFSTPSGLPHDQDFELTRDPDHDASKFEEGAERMGLAQVHRADPGSIYFTLQEGTNNPTYTLKHKGDATWKGIPKKRKVKEPMLTNVDMGELQRGIKEAFEQQAGDSKKSN